MYCSIEYYVNCGHTNDLKVWWSQLCLRFRQLQLSPKNVFGASTGLELMASALLLQCYTNWAMTTHNLGAGQFVEFIVPVKGMKHMNIMWTGDIQMEWRCDCCSCVCDLSSQHVLSSPSSLLMIWGKCSILSEPRCSHLLWETRTVVLCPHKHVFSLSCMYNETARKWNNWELMKLYVKNYLNLLQLHFNQWVIHSSWKAHGFYFLILLLLHICYYT